MRKTITHCLFLLTFLVPFAQSYHPIPSTGAQFRVEYQYFDALTPGFFSSTVWHQYTAGDTIIDSLTVTQIHTGPKVVCASSGLAGAFTPLVYEGYLLQDSLQGKVYYKKPGSAPELLFDFAANPGDTIPLPSGLDIYSTNYEFIVQSVDTVTYSDGIPRRRLKLTWPNWAGDAPEWVEGIGDIKFGFLPVPSFEDLFYATCYQEFGLDLVDGSPSYCPMPSSCGLLVNQETPELQEVVQLRNNPGNIPHFVGIQQPMEVVVYSLQGQIVAEETVTADGPVRGTEGLSRGLYLVRLQPISGGESMVLRWVKE